jgi:IS4 transposase
MDDKQLLDLYSDYLISSFGQTTGTGMADLLEGSISHDRIQRLLSKQAFTSADLWQIVKPHVRAIERDDGVLIVDDSIAEKPYTDENDIICWHYDHAHDCQVKGINFLTALYHVRGQSLPVGFRIVAKTEYYIHKKDGKTKRRSPISKNEHYQALVRQAKANQIPFKYVLNDVWYASADNMNFIKEELQLDFIMPLKANRKVALSLQDKAQGRYVRLDQVTLEPDVVRMVYLEAVSYPLALVKQVFVNEDDSIGIQYLVSSDLSLTGEQIMALYRKRWNVEPFHKSLKQNASLEKSPTQTVRTQTNHLFASFCGYIKLELLKQSTHLNHFALKSRLYLSALRSAFDQLRQFHPVRLAA